MPAFKPIHPLALIWKLDMLVPPKLNANGNAMLPEMASSPDVNVTVVAPVSGANVVVPVVTV